jgi:CubicO group peptidase (beta-lactamase class C family)
MGSPGEWDGPYWSLLGAGGVISTVGDLYLWQQALQHGRVLSPEMVEKLWTPYAAVTEGTSYSYGWQISQTDYGGRLIWHVGAGRSHNAELRYYPERETVIIIGSNRIDDRYLGIGRLYETFHEIIYANEVGKTLSRNVLNNDFSLQPALALPTGFFISLPEFILALGLMVLLIWLAVRYWRLRGRKIVESDGESVVK